MPEITQHCLTNLNGMSVKLMNYGATLTSLQVPTKNGMLAELTLGLDTLEEYINHPFYFGCTIGRVANRISRGKFDYRGKLFQLDCNENNMCHLHGGKKGLDKVIWKAESFQDENTTSIIFSTVSQDGEEGYPGNLYLQTIYTLTQNNALKISYFAKTDQPTPVSLTNHTYWNLANVGEDSILGHELQLFSDAYLDTDNNIPTGAILSVRNTLFDFGTPKLISEGIYDHCYILRNPTIQPQIAARLRDPDSNRIMEVYTTQPGIQLYTGNHLSDYSIAAGKKINRHAGLCLETQGFPDAVNHTHFPSVMLLPESSYKHETIYQFYF